MRNAHAQAFVPRPTKDSVHINGGAHLRVRDPRFDRSRIILKQTFEVRRGSFKVLLPAKEQGPGVHQRLTLQFTVGRQQRASSACCRC